MDWYLYDLYVSQSSGVQGVKEGDWEMATAFGYLEVMDHGYLSSKRWKLIEDPIQTMLSDGLLINNDDAE